MEGLPEELTMLILVKLPVKSLLRSKCVRKSWYSLINSPQFIRLHRSSSSPQFIFFHLIELGKEEPRPFLSFHSYETLDDLGNGDLGNDVIDNPIRALWANDLRNDVSLSGSCDGLVCFHSHYDTDYYYNKTDQILICNPAIREFRSVFVPPDYHIDSVAFGSDPKTGQFKVVMIGVDYLHHCVRDAKVYDFSTESWRDTGTDDVIRPGFPYSPRAVSLNGAFHWCPEDWDILTFHISDEVTGSIPMPGFASAFLGRELYVSSKSQQLSLVLHDLEGRYEICVMTEYGVKESWTRLFQIGPLSNVISDPLAFWGEQQQLLLLTKDGQLVSCDLQHKNHHLLHFPIHGHLDVKLYSESLVSVHGIFGQ